MRFVFVVACQDARVGLVSDTPCGFLWYLMTVVLDSIRVIDNNSNFPNRTFGSTDDIPTVVLVRIRLLGTAIVVGLLPQRVSGL